MQKNSFNLSLVTNYCSSTSGRVIHMVLRGNASTLTAVCIELESVPKDYCKSLAVLVSDNKVNSYLFSAKNGVQKILSLGARAVLLG